MNAKKTRLLLLITIAVVVFGAIVFSERSNAQLGEVTVVKLYSGGQLVATWDNAHRGMLEGNTYVFKIAPQDKEVRINGSYSVEVIR